MAFKQKVDDSGYKQLKKELSEEKLGNLYILHGEEVYLRDFYLGRMKEQLVGDGMAEFNLHVISDKEFTPELLEQMVDNLPMMSQRTMILITDYDLSKAGDKDKQTLTELFSQLPEYCCVVFVYDLIGYKLDARTKLAAAIKENGLVVEFARQEQSDLVDWVHRRFRALGKEIDREQAQYLIFQCGDLMNGLIGEIEKIGAYAKGARITRQDIDAVATPQLDAVTYEMTNAVGMGDFDKAASILGELFQMQEPAIKIMFSLGKHMRQLYSARLALENRQTAGDLLSLWGLKPYPAQKLTDSARRFSLAWCRKAVAACAKTDLALKSGNSGREREILCNLLLELASAEKK